MEFPKDRLRFAGAALSVDSPCQMKPQSIRLFIKPGCPWCHEAIDWLDERGIAYATLDVIRDADARAEMRELTDQTKAPSIDVDGHILADFGADELEEWWRQMEFEPRA
jgi:glutaredoxin 3